MRIKILDRVLLCFLVTHSITSAQADENPWGALLNVSTAQFRRLFLPANVDLLKELHNNPQISAQCRDLLEHSLIALDAREEWSVKMFNSWGRFPPAGIRQGTFTDIGDFDQCIAVDSPQHDTQYCLVETPIPMPPRAEYSNLFDQYTEILLGNNNTSSFYHSMANVSAFYHHMTIQTGICLPSICTQEDVVTLGTAFASNFNLKSYRASCQRRQDNSQLDRAQIFALLVLGSAIGLNILAYVMSKLDSNNGKPRVSGQKESRLQWFNPVANAKKLLHSPTSEGDLGAVHGIRALTIMWVVAGHALDWNSLNMYRTSFAIRDRFGQWITQPFFKAYFSVDTFFLLSGLLTSYVTLKFTAGKFKNFNVFAYVAIRYLRLTPQMAIFLLLGTLLPLLGSGPVWKKNMDFMVQRCYQTWWRNMLYIQNMYDVQNMCSLHSWYLAVDMQLHLAALVPIALFLWNRQIGLRITKLSLLFWTGVLAVIIFVRHLPPGMLITLRYNLLDDDGGPTDYLAFFYKPWTHAAPFFIGILFGYWTWYASRVELKQSSQQEQEHEKLAPEDRPTTPISTSMRSSLASIQLTKKQKTGVWTMCIVLYLFSMYSTMPWHYGKVAQPWVSAILYPLNVIFWSLMMVTILWMCVTKNGGYINRILSAPFWRPMSRLTYAVYLTHPWVIATLLGSQRQPFSQELSTILPHLITVFIFSYVIGFLFSVLFETPLCLLMEHLRSSISNNRHRLRRRSSTATAEHAMLPTAVVTLPPNNANELSEKDGFVEMKSTTNSNKKEQC